MRAGKLSDVEGEAASTHSSMPELISSSDDDLAGAGDHCPSDSSSESSESSEEPPSPRTAPTAERRATAPRVAAAPRPPPEPESAVDAPPEEAQAAQQSLSPLASVAMFIKFIILNKL